MRLSWSKGTSVAYAVIVFVSVIVFSSYLLEHERTSSWNPKSAAAYLDRRESDWAKWPGAARDQETFCVSCHTALPYALARPALRTVLGEQAPSPQEITLVDDVTKRVRHWSEVKPYYDSMTAQSRGTEAVLNALVLASHDAQTGHLSADSLSAFGDMWETQQMTGHAKGAWPWIQLGNEPWEAPDSMFYGACLAAVAVGLTPNDYRSSSALQSNIELLREYLVQESAKQPPMNRAALLWASASFPGLLTSSEQRSLVDEMLSQQRPDGGWTLSSLAGTWRRSDGTALVGDRDGYATGLVVLSLEELGFPQNEGHVRKGLSWLHQHQNRWDGGWAGYSLNRRRHDPFSMVSQFMNDAATAYAVLALTHPSLEAGGIAQPRQVAVQNSIP